MVNLREFVRDAIVEIVKAVKEAQDATEEIGAAVNPVNVVTAHKRTHDGSVMRHVEDIQFDVAVTATEGADTGAKIGVMAGIFGSAVTGSINERSEAISRIKFSVPVALPPHKRLTTASDDGMGGQTVQRSPLDPKGM